MLYFPIFWLLSIFVHVSFFMKLRWNERKYNIAIERYTGNKYPKIGKIKSIISSTNDLNLKRDFKILLLLSYLSYILFVIPLVIYFITGIFFAS